MPDTTVDARGLPCPQPVILTRKALQALRQAQGEACDAVMTIVDNEAARQNVARMAERMGCAVRVEQRDEGICLFMTKGETSVQAEDSQAVAMPSRGQGTAGPLVLLIPSEFMGRGEDAELGHILMRAFFHTLAEGLDLEGSTLPDTIVFLNSGVKLVAQGSVVLEDLRALNDSGIHILACGTCLGQYGLKEQLAVGVVSNMYDIAETLLQAGKVINL